MSINEICNGNYKKIFMLNDNERKILIDNLNNCINQKIGNYELAQNIINYYNKILSLNNPDSELYKQTIEKQKKIY
jgi:hypothetical protein